MGQPLSNNITSTEPLTDSSICIHILSQNGFIWMLRWVNAAFYTACMHLRYAHSTPTNSTETKCHYWIKKYTSYVNNKQNIDHILLVRKRIKVMNVHCLCSSSRWQKWVDKKQIVNYSKHIFHKKQCMCILLLGISSKGACQGH